MNWKRKFLLLYSLVGFAGVVFVEFQNVYVLGRSWEKILKYNLPFVFCQYLVFVSIYYFYTVKNLQEVFQSFLQPASHRKREEYFHQLILFPYRLFKFSIVFMFGLALAFHLYEMLFLEKVTKSYFINILDNLLREMSLAMIITIMIMAALKNAMRPYILQLQITSIEKAYLPLKNKIYFIFFALLFIILTDTVWLLLHANVSGEKLIIKITVTLGLLSIMAIMTIKLTILDSIQYIHDTLREVAVQKLGKRESVRASVPIPSSDEIGLLIGGFNQLQEKVGELYQEVDHELELAYLVQRHLLPKQKWSVGSFVMEGMTIQVKEVGGDFFDIIPVGKRRLAILIGDVSGKGLPAALIMSAMLGMVRGKMQIHKEWHSPAHLLSEVNQILVPMLTEGMFVTAGLGIVDLDTNRFIYASAGHMPPLVKRNGRLTYADISSLPLGMDPNEVYEELVLPLTELDGVIFYTDGMIEQTDKNHHKLGFDAWNEAVLRSWDQDIKSLLSEVQMKDLLEKYNDDRTLVRMKRTDLTWIGDQDEIISYDNK